MAVLNVKVLKSLLEPLELFQLAFSWFSQMCKLVLHISHVFSVGCSCCGTLITQLLLVLRPQSKTLGKKSAMFFEKVLVWHNCGFAQQFNLSRIHTNIMNLWH